MIDIVCVKVGDKYGPEYVNRLYAMVKRHLSRSWIFRCLTDDPGGLDCRISPIKVNTNLEGWWAKMLLFDLSPCIYPLLYLDLDTVIVDNIDFLAGQKKMAILSDFYYPEHYQSAMMVIDTAHSWIWGKFQEDRQRYEAMGGDQNAIEEMLREKNDQPAILQDLFPRKIVSYKVHCQNRVPDGAAIVCFHGHPRPHEADAAWIAEHWRE